MQSVISISIFQIFYCIITDILKPLKKVNIKVKSKVNVFSFFQFCYIPMYYRWFYSTFDEFTFISLKRTCSDALICEKLPFLLLTQLPKKCSSCQLVIRVIITYYGPSIFSILNIFLFLCQYAVCPIIFVYLVIK